MNRYQSYLSILEKALRETDAWRSKFGDVESRSDENSSEDDISDIIDRLQKRLEGNYPFHHPQYAGQMLKPPHPVAWIAYSLTATINPNNHALDGGPPTSQMEKEVVDRLAKMVGYDDPYLGHLTSGGTIANLEALYVAREIHPNKKIAASSRAHYTHSRMCRILNTPFLEIPDDGQGVPDIDFLDRHKDEVGTLVVTMGTTGLGTVEPLADLLEWAQKTGVRVHADAAYGGFFKIISNRLESRPHWEVLHRADSIVMDPHKHGLQPYGCGSILFKNPAVGKFYSHDSPYTYFTSDDLHLGEISLECSRAGASAAALWATFELLPLTKSGLGAELEKSLEAARKMYDELKESDFYEVYRRPDLDILGYFPMPTTKNVSEVSRLSKAVFEKGMERPEAGFHVSLYRVSADEFLDRFPGYTADEGHVTILRSVLMKPEHLEFIPELVQRLHQKLSEV